MSPKVQIDLSSSRCAKKGCKNFSKLHRHHLRHEKHWLNVWLYSPTPTFKGSKQQGRTAISILKLRYFQFREVDTVRLCESHHVEIHVIYSSLLRRFSLIEFKKHEAAFSVEEALHVMRVCKKACLEWLKEETPGIDPKSAGWRLDSDR